MKLELFLNMLTVLEIIAVEFISIWVLSQKKHKFWAACGLYTAITVGIILFMYFVAARLPGYGNGSGQFMILGVVYFVPALFSFGGLWKNRLIIAFYSFSYGLAGFALSVRLGYLFPAEWLAKTVFIIQTLLYALTLPLYLRFSKSRVIPYVHKADASQKNMLIRYTIVSFILIILYNNVMTMEASPLKKLLVYVLLLYFIILTYRLTVYYLKADDDNQELSELAMSDKLTGLGNRLAFRDGAEKLLEEGGAFTLLFLDLDTFKSINDRFGHQAGDLYLKSFAEALKAHSGGAAAFYRLAGDEFVVLSREEGVYDTLLGLPVTLPGDIPFLGFSMGEARYPEDGRTLSELFEAADKRMYQQKKDKY